MSEKSCVSFLSPRQPDAAIAYCWEERIVDVHYVNAPRQPTSLHGPACTPADRRMKDSLDHLPQQKQQELAQIAEVVRSASDDIEMVILFGSYARGGYKVKADLSQDRWSGHLSDYDILAVTGKLATAEDSDLSRGIADQCLALGLSATVRLILHDIEFLNNKLAEGQYFFSDIKKEGCWLYNSGKFKLSRKRELTPHQQQRIAQDFYDYCYKNATMFFGGFEDFFRKAKEDKDHLQLAAFNLHQAAEAAYKTILLVFTNYCPDEHFLKLLGELAAKHHSPITKIFPRQTRPEQICFEQLDLAYIGARYHVTWRITKEELQHLSPCVQELLDVTETICQARIRGLVPSGD